MTPATPGASERRDADDPPNPRVFSSLLPPMSAVAVGAATPPRGIAVAVGFAKPPHAVAPAGVAVAVGLNFPSSALRELTAAAAGTNARELTAAAVRQNARLLVTTSDELELARDQDADALFVQQ